MFKDPLNGIGPDTEFFKKGFSNFVMQSMIFFENFINNFATFDFQDHFTFIEQSDDGFFEFIDQGMD